jgi:hypothetical protein
MTLDISQLPALKARCACPERAQTIFDTVTNKISPSFGHSFNNYHHGFYSTSAFPPSGGMENQRKRDAIDIQLQVYFHVVWWKCEIV